MTKTIYYRDREFDCECEYNPPFIGGSYEGREFERLGDDYTLTNVYLNGVDVTDRIQRFCNGLFDKLQELVNELN